MSSACILSPISQQSNGATSTMATSRLPTIHPALRPSSSTNLPANNNGMIQDKNYYVDSYCQSSSEILNDTITLLSGSNGPKRVILSVFRTTVDHFALVYPDNRRKIVASKPIGCINLRGVTCEETVLGNGLKGFTLRPKKCDTSFAALVFVCSDENMLPKWLDALSPLSSSSTILAKNNQNASPLMMNGSLANKRNSCRQSSLPSLEEEEE